MLYKCANPACSNLFRRMSEGKLYYVETEYFESPKHRPHVGRKRHLRRVEHYWMCDECSPFLSLAFDKDRGVITMPLPNMDGIKTVRVVAPDSLQKEEEANLLTGSE